MTKEQEEGATVRRETQKEKIKAHLLAGRSLTQLQALRLFGCMRLAPRIYELRDQGHNIATVYEFTRGGSKVARYSMSDI